ncbi:mechanosensitive ion channel family protein [Paraliomyxa miuraensis]|uniref:mechanosensitive ion channel family protein n=1 Tax=Paraliomyxa miuraensis TaxID=376150 RepID=UPI0022539026|nr:mechanosensitive ion channel domain-containing protein [Paraliomyxa miuraensis]MCX4241627.1 mechanosensitive ion channel [Paraliomyxa miuraensis]
MPPAYALLAEPTGVLEHLDVKLFEVGGTSVTLATALSALLVITFTAWLAKVMRRLVRRVFERRGLGEGTAGTVGGILYYVVLVTGFGVALQTIGIDLAALFTAGAIFAIGLGFAMQNIAQNFMSGVILLTERAIKPGDVLEVEGDVVKVRQMGIRATIVQTRDGEEIIVPNSVLAQSSVKNYTLEDSKFRLRAAVGVLYSSDLRRVRARLEEVSREQSWRLAAHEPEVYLSEFGDNAVIYEIFVWMSDPWRERAARSSLHEAIWWAFKEEGVVIAFPQLDLHLDEDVAGSLRALGGARRGA